MNSNLIMFLIAILILVIGAGAGWGITNLTQKGKDPKSLLGTADTVIDGVKSANDTFGKLIPAPIEFIIDKVLQTAQAGVHAAQQLCDSDQLTEDQRKQKAFDSAINLLKLEGYQPTPELEAAVKDAIETGVFVMKNIVKSSVAVPEAQKTGETTAVPESVTVSADPSAPTQTTEVSAQPTVQQAVTQAIRQTVQPVAQQAAYQTVQDIIAEAVQSGVKQIQPSA